MYPIFGGQSRNMNDFLKSRWVLFVVLVVFVMFKIPHLLYPFYWDESVPYVTAIKEMYRNGISLIPGAINVESSRGHPMFFHATAATWMHIFGPSNFSLHCFALSISLLFLVTIYETGYRVYNSRVAAIALFLTATHVSFFVQSSFVLFEILVAFLCFLSIVLYTKEKYVLCTIALTALFLTKESGMIAGFVIGIDSLICLFKKELRLKTKLLKIMPVAVACMAIGLFFIVQKQKTGFYVLPLYSETIRNNWRDFWYQFHYGCISTNFFQDYEDALFIALLIFTVAMIIKQRSRKSLFLLFAFVPATLGYLFFGDRASLFDPGFASQMAFGGFIVFYIVALLAYCNPAYYTSKTQTKLALMLGWFVLCFLLFSSAGYFIRRYLLACIVPTLFLLAVFLDMVVRGSYRVLIYPLLILIVASSFFAFRESTGWDDGSMAFIDALKMQLGTVEFLERSHFHDKHISAPFLCQRHLRDTNTGFLAGADTFKYVVNEIEPNTDLIVLNNVETDENKRNQVLKDTSFQLLYKITNNEVWCEIYKRK